MQRKLRYGSSGQVHEIVLTRGATSELIIVIGDRVETVRPLGGSPFVAQIGRRVVRAAIERRPGGWQIEYDGGVFVLQEPDAAGASRGSGQVRASTSAAGAVSPMPGTVVKIFVAKGEHVRAHQPLLVLEAMKMEHVVEAPHDGVVEAVRYEQGDMVDAGATVVELVPE